MERKIGEIFEFGGEWYQCVEHKGCHSCAFALRRGFGFECVFKGTPRCTCRSDGKLVIFKKLEKVGEPYFNGQYGEVLQEYKYYIPPITPDLGIHIIKLGIVGIEIKQNKEDMEEKKFCGEISKANEVNMVFKIASKYINGGITYDEFEEYMRSWINNGKKESKPNLKPFDLQKAREGKPVCTMSRKKARIICFDAKGVLPIIALVESGDEEKTVRYSNSGRFRFDGTPDEEDLIMLSEKKEGWVNVYKGGLLDTKSYSSKEEAVSKASQTDYADTIKIEWEE